MEKHGVDFNPPERLKVLILPVEFDVKIKKITAIKSVDGSISESENRSLINTEIENIKQNVWFSIFEEMSKTYLLKPLPIIETLEHEGESIPTDEISRISFLYKPDLILKTKISGYGTIKKKWQMLLLGSGLGEGVVQGFLSYKLLKSKTAAILIALEEFIQEALVWGAGVYLFNKAFSPVIIETKLISARDGRVIWSMTSFTTIDRKAIKKYPQDKQELKELRLKITAEKAVKEIVKSLEKEAFKNAIKER